jgi:hypothetical protein
MIRQEEDLTIFSNTLLDWTNQLQNNPSTGGSCKTREEFAIRFYDHFSLKTLLEIKLTFSFIFLRIPVAERIPI